MNSKEVQLKDILAYGGLTSGYSFRGRINEDPNGEMQVIQLKNFTNDYSEIDTNCVFVDGSKINDRYLLKENDILFIAKGANNYAVTFKEDKTPTIASSALFVIRVDTKFAIPQYIAWYINQKPVQNYFDLNQLGTYTMSINKKTLENVPLLLPDIKTQKSIAQLADLQRQEQNIYTQLKELRKKLIQNQLLKAI